MSSARSMPSTRSSILATTPPSLKAPETPEDETHSVHSVPVKLFVFDFDQTLSVCHVFKTLAGWDNYGMPVKEPYATTEIGQIRKIEELNKESRFAKNGGFPTVALGGESRVRALKSMCQELKKTGAYLIVCTKGLIGTFNKFSEAAGLAGCFDEVYGRNSQSYGFTEYDVDCCEENCSDITHLLGAEFQAEWRAKDELCRNLMTKKELDGLECILVEDDPRECDAASEVCRTLLVEEAAGITQQDMNFLVSIARGRETTHPPDPAHDEIQFDHLPTEAWCDGTKRDKGDDGEAGVAKWKGRARQSVVSGGGRPADGLPRVSGKTMKGMKSKESQEADDCCTIL